MQRWLQTACVIVLATTVVLADEDKPKASKPTEAYKALEKEFMEQLKNTKDRDELFKKYAKLFYEHAAANPKDDSALEALIMVLRMSEASKDKEAPATKALDTLRQNYVKSPRIGTYLALFGSRPDELNLEFLKVVQKENPDRKIQAKACKILEATFSRMEQMSKRLKGDDDLRERFEKLRGKEFVQGIVDGAERYAKESKTYAKLMEKYADIFPLLAVGKVVPDTESEDLEGKKVKPSDLRGKVVVLDIWATWCGPCRAMIPHTRELVKKMKDKPFVFVNISGDDEKQTVINFLKKEEMPWTHWWGRNDIVEAWQIEAFPTIFILDHKGVIRYRDLRGKDMDEAVEKLVKECEDEKKAKSE